MRHPWLLTSFLLPPSFACHPESTLSGTADVVHGDDTNEPDTSGPEGGDSGEAPEPEPVVLGVELLTDGGFETGTFGAWLPSGCQVVSSSADGGQPYEGDWMLYGGLDHCRAAQEVDLLASAGAGVAEEIDAGRVGVVASGWVADRFEAGAYDDQVMLIVEFLDAGGEGLGRLESLLGADGEWALRELAGALPAGTRRLRVEVEARFRQGSANESRADALSVQITALAPLPAEITLPPMLSDHRQEAMRILWETDRLEAAPRVEWGPVGSAELAERAEGAAVSSTQVAADRYVHSATISGLEAAQRAEYRVCVGEVCSERYTFQSAPPPGSPVRVGFMADNQDNLFGYFEEHIAHLQARSPDLLVMAGDVVQEGGDLSQWTSQWWRPLSQRGFAQGVPVLVALGNHEKEHPYTYAYASSPERSAWYRFRYGDVYFVVLDSNVATESPDSRLSQARYLQDALASQDAREALFRVVVFHDAPFNSVTTTVDPKDSSWGWADAQEDWVPLFEAGQVDLVVSGHYHSYQRGAQDGVVYVVVGGGGASLLPGAAESGPHAAMFEVSTHAWHYAVMDVTPEGLSWQTFDLDDALLDSFALPPRTR